MWGVNPGIRARSCEEISIELFCLRDTNVLRKEPMKSRSKNGNKVQRDDIATKTIPKVITH